MVECHWNTRKRHPEYYWICQRGVSTSDLRGQHCSLYRDAQVPITHIIHSFLFDSTHTHTHTLSLSLSWHCNSWDWRAVKEDDQMYRCVATNELLHPCWVSEELSPQKPRNWETSKPPILYRMLATLSFSLLPLEMQLTLPIGNLQGFSVLFPASTHLMYLRICPFCRVSSMNPHHNFSVHLHTSTY